MIKLLVANGSELTGEVYKNISSDYEAVKYCLDQGIDPNFDNSLPGRNAIKGTYKSPENIGEGFFEIFKLLIDYGAKTGEVGGRNMTVKWAAEYGRLDFLDYMIEKGCKTGFKQAVAWISHSRKLPADIKQKVMDYLKDKIEKYEKD